MKTDFDFVFCNFFQKKFFLFSQAIENNHGFLKVSWITSPQNKFSWKSIPQKPHSCDSQSTKSGVCLEKYFIPGFCVCVELGITCWKRENIQVVTIINLHISEKSCNLSCTFKMRKKNISLLVMDSLPAQTEFYDFWGFQKKVCFQAALL